MLVFFYMHITISYYQLGFEVETVTVWRAYERSTVCCGFCIVTTQQAGISLVSGIVCVSVK